MDVITNLPAGLRTGTAVALGFFDGVHLGHRAVLAAADEPGLLRAAFTFSTAGRSPGGKRAGRIYPDAVRCALLGGCGMSLVVMPEFSAIAEMGPEEFADLLCGELRAKKVSCGEDYRFAAGARADVRDLRRLCAARGCAVEVVPPVLCGGGRVSSTRIRALLAGGRMEEAARLLGEPYRIEAAVEPGKKLGRTLGFPTINQSFPPDAALPRRGVYASQALLEGEWLPAVTNVGVRPTVGEGLAERAETYIEGYAGDLYGKPIPVRLLRFLRPEQRFGSIEELRAQIARDLCARRELKDF